MWDCVQDRLIPTTPQIMRNLLEIEIANDIEQRDLSVSMKPRYLSRRKHMLARCKAFMSPAAQAALAKLIEAARGAKLSQYAISQEAGRNRKLRSGWNETPHRQNGILLFGQLQWGKSNECEFNRR